MTAKHASAGAAPIRSIRFKRLKTELCSCAEGFRALGCSAVYAAPFELLKEPVKQYRGTRAMYLELGFKEIERRDSLSVMRLGF